jgi:small-conductance mechanosensitive channel
MNSKISGFLDYKLIEVSDYQLTLLNILSIILVLIVTKLILLLLKRIIVTPKKFNVLEEGRRMSIFFLVRYFVWSFAIVLCLQIIGVQITLLLAGLSALLVGFGLGIQNIFNDIVSGIFLLFEGTIQIGDVIEIDNMVCEVEEISLRTSKVVTRDDITIIIPNRNFINDKVINWSRQPNKQARFHIQVGVSYKSNPREVQKILTEVMLNHPDILKDKPYQPFVRFIEYGDSAIVFDMVFWSKRTFRIENVKSDLYYDAFDKLKENNIEIPFPQRDIHFRSSDIPLFYKGKE